MRTSLLSIGLFITTLIHGQPEFMMTENGLKPEFITTEISPFTQADLYKKTLRWIEETASDYTTSILGKTDNELIDVAFVKGNVAVLDKQYFNARYAICISFKEGQYEFRPTKLELKLNSKYDMGWKIFDLSNSVQYYKKGKIRRKYKAYLKDLTSILNTLNNNLGAYLKQKKYRN